MNYQKVKRNVFLAINKIDDNIFIDSMRNTKDNTVFEESLKELSTKNSNERTDIIEEMVIHRLYIFNFIFLK